MNVFTDLKGKVLKDSVGEDINYSLVPERAWRKLVLWYGLEVSSHQKLNLPLAMQ